LRSPVSNRRRSDRRSALRIERALSKIFVDLDQDEQEIDAC
jgi:hypothetical protein